MLNSTARTSASSLAVNGRRATARHCKRRRAYSHFSSSIPSNIRSYVSSKVLGNSFSARRMLPGKLRRSISSWRKTQRNLDHGISVIIPSRSADPLHSIGFCSQRVDDKPLIFLPPLFQPRIRLNDRLDIVDDILPLATLVMKGDTMRCQGLKDSLDVNLWPTCDTNMYVPKS